MEPTKTMFLLDWDKSHQSGKCCYFCKRCKELGIPHEVISIICGPANVQCWLGDVQLIKQTCTGCNEEFGPFIGK